MGKLEAGTRAGPGAPAWAAAGSRLRARLLGRDDTGDLAAVLALFALFLLLDRLTRLAAHLEADDLGRPSLVMAAAANRWWAFAGVGLLLAAAARWRGSGLTAPWSTLEQGRILRLGAGLVVALLAWQNAWYPVNWYAGRLHGGDRLLVVALAAAVVARPVFLLPFVVAVRVAAEQFVFPFATAAGRNIDDLLVMTLVAVAAVHLLVVVTGRNRTAPVLLVVTAALAAHFYIPGKGKLAIGWLEAGDLADLPLSSYTAGWLGHTDGAWAETLSGLYRRFRLPVMAATLALELGSVPAVVHPRLTRWWLPGCVAFHVVIFATTGFWFLSWIVVEVGLIAILAAPPLRSWVAGNLTPARGMVTALAVLAAPVLFHPPGLAWLDAPVSYGYQLEGTGTSGVAYHVPASALAPLSLHVAFDRLQLGDAVPASGAYGAVTTASEVERLAAVDDFDDLQALESVGGRPTLKEESQLFLARYLAHAHRSRPLPVRVLSPPEHFWTSRPEPAYRLQEPLESLRVYLVRAIHHHGNPEHHRELVLELRIDDEGRVETVAVAG